MNQEKELYTKSDITAKLGIQSYILSLWEKEFNIPRIIAADGQVLYTSLAHNQLTAIKELIYTQGFSLEAAKKSLQNPNDQTMVVPASHVLYDLKKEPAIKTPNPAFTQNLRDLQKQLIKFRELL